MKIIINLGLLLAISQITESSMCYFCSDTSGAKGRNSCQTWVRTMNYYRKKFLDTKKFSTEKYVKNCTGFGSGDRRGACMIASIEGQNGVSSFIRGCTDGTTFFSEDIDTHFKDNTLQDNQTACHYAGQGYLACVTVCSPAVHGDFCNGYIIAAQTRCAYDIMLITSLICMLILKHFGLLTIH
ncbi:hypothetical protein ACF0H5_019594 [Mactra antiquata]